MPASAGECRTATAGAPHTRPHVRPRACDGERASESKGESKGAREGGSVVAAAGRGRGRGQPHFRFMSDGELRIHKNLRKKNAHAVLLTSARHHTRMSEIYRKPAYTVSELERTRQHQETGRPSWSAR